MRLFRDLNRLRDGSDVTIIACGLMVLKSLHASEALFREGILARVVDMHTIKPIDKNEIISCARETGCLVTAEEHVLDGGLGSAVSEVAGDIEPVPIERIGMDNTFTESGNYKALQDKYGLTVEAVVEAAKSVLARKRSC